MPDGTTDSARLQVEWWRTDKPIPYARNARVCPEAAIAKVAGSIHEFGFKNPILVDGEGVIIAGHTRLAAAQRLGLEHVPVIACPDLSPAKVKALRLADNRTAQETSWDDELLAVELEELLGLEYDVTSAGFDEEEIAMLLAEPMAGLVEADEAPPVPETPVSAPGDLWILGEHRLLCGDSTAADDVERLMAGERAALMATDPPYLVDYDGGNHPDTEANGGKWGNQAKEKHWDAYTDHESAIDFYVAFLTLALKAALIERPAVYQWFGAMRADIVFAAWRASGLLPHQMLIWKKSRTVLTHSHFMWDYEPMMYGWVEGKKPALKPPADARAVWEIESRIDDGATGIHPTQKPIETLRRPIEYHTKPGQLVYEPFSGSGTALIAAEEMGRRCRAIELSPAFVDVAVLRWQTFTGRDATLDDNDRTFAAVAEERSE